MSLRTWMLGLIRDDQTHEEIDKRKVETDSLVAELRVERRRNGFGEMFGRDAGLGRVRHPRREAP